MPSLHASPEYTDSQKRRRRLFVVRGGARARARFLIIVIAIILVVLPHLIGLVNLLVGNALIAFSFGEFDLQRMLFLGWDRGTTRVFKDGCVSVFVHPLDIIWPLASLDVLGEVLRILGSIILLQLAHVFGHVHTINSVEVSAG